LAVDNVFITLLLDDECVFLGYSAEYKGYRCWNPVGRKMCTSRDVAFDEPRPFYLRPSSDASFASLVEPLSFLFFPDAPSAPLLISRPALPSLVPPSMSSGLPLWFQTTQ
jgi:hypothetical protein